MNAKTGAMIRTSFFISAFLVLIVSNSVFSQSNSSQRIVTLFELSNAVQKQISNEPEIVQKQNIQINEAIFQENAISEGDQITLSLFSDETIEAEITRVSTNIMGATSITGKITGKIPGNAIITYKDKRLFGTIHLYDQHRHFNIKSDSKTAEHYLVEKDIEAMDPFECGGAITVSDDRESEMMNRYRKEN